MKTIMKNIIIVVGLLGFAAADHAKVAPHTGFMQHDAEKGEDVTPLVVAAPDLMKHVLPALNENQEKATEGHDREEPEGGTEPWGPKDAAVIWPEESKIPRIMQFVLAGAWVAMLCSIPFVMRLVDHKPITQTQKLVGGLELVVVLGGFYLFTNIILFQSIHFKTIRPLTMVECIYFMSQVITTVGYGDVTPAKIRGQVFVGLYVLGALFIIAMLISDLTTHVVAAAQEYRSRLHKDRNQEIHAPITCKGLVTPQKPSTAPLVAALMVFGGIDICWILFFWGHPGEGKTVFQAVYMSVITLSSVGFGFFTPVTEEGMIFGAFFMLIGVGALGNVISNFTELMVKMNEWERFSQEVEENGMTGSVERLRGIAKGQAQVSQAQFLQFALLEMKLVSQEDLALVEEAFGQLKPQEGMVGFKKIEEQLNNKVENRRASIDMLK